MLNLSLYPKTITSRDGKSFTVRVLTSMDEAELHRFMCEIPPEERVFFRDDVADANVVRQWCHALNLNRVIPLVLLDGKRIVADMTLHFEEHGWTRHLAEIRGVVQPEYRRRGLGVKVILELLSLAQSLDYERVFLQIAKPQKGALLHFTGIGFGVEAVLKDWVKDLNGEHQDMLVLATRIEPAWRLMEEMVMDSDLGGQ